MLGLFLLILASACFASLYAPRHSLLAIASIGFLQDPFRKMIAGEPIFLIVTVGLVFGTVFLSVLQRFNASRLTEPFTGWSGDMKQPIGLFMVILALQFVHSMLRYGNPVISVIGLLSYTAPFFAIVVGYFLVTRAHDIHKFMQLYVLVGLVLGVTVIMSFSGIDSILFKEVGRGLTIYDQGTILRSFSGFMRTGEIAAWHMATACCFLIILYFSSKRRLPTWVVVVLILFMLTAIALTGRRKMLMLVTMFGFVYGLGFAYYRSSVASKYLAASGLAVLAVWVLIEVVSPGGYGSDSGISNYIARSSSVYSDASSRAIKLGLDPINWAITRVGFLGGGLGIASQGSQLFNIGSIAGGSGEGGLGKIVVELGVPGLMAAIWLAFSFAKYINSAIKLSAQHFVPLHVMPLMLGMAVALFVNVLTFSVATQVYGDMFILIMIGLMAGFLFALPKLVIRAIEDDRPMPPTTNQYAGMPAQPQNNV